MKSNPFIPQLSTAPVFFNSLLFDKVIEWLIVSLLAFMPFAFGAVEAWSEEIFIALAAAICICFLLKLVFQKDAGLVWSRAYIPVILFILIIIFQLISLPTTILNVLSPNTVAIKKELLGDLSNSNELLHSMTLSFYPHATKHDLRLVLAVAGVFFVIVNVYNRAEQIKRLLAAIAIIGGTVAMLALAQNLFGNGKIYWLVPTGNAEVYSGTFINHSHYGQFMNLSIGAALGLGIVKANEIFRAKKITLSFVLEYLNWPAAKVIWLLSAMIVIGAATVFISLTRGGIVSMLVAASFTTLVLSSRRSLKGGGWIMTVMALGAFICVLYVGFDAVYDRLATLRELHEYKGRWQILKDLSVSFRRFPVLGTGLGTHEVVYPMFDRSTMPSLAAYAENEYAQAAEETGLIGLAALVSFAVIVWISYVRNIRSASVPIRSAAYGLGFGLVAIMLHSISDFGQHLPANAMLSAVFCALLLALARRQRTEDRRQTTEDRRQKSNGLRFAALVCVSGISIWALLGANSARVAEAHWKKAVAVEHKLAEQNWQGTKNEYGDLISHAAAAADFEPENIKYKHWLNVYQWHYISRMTDPNTGEVIMAPQALEFAKRIVHELHQARTLCPTFGAIYCVLGQLEKFILDDPSGVEHIRKGFQLAPCDPTACLVAGFLDATEGKIEDSYKKLEKAVLLDGRFFRNVADVYINHVNRPDLAMAIAGDSTERLSYIANVLADYEEYQDIAEKIQVKMKDLLEAKRQPFDGEVLRPAASKAEGTVEPQPNTPVKESPDELRDALAGNKRI